MKGAHAFSLPRLLLLLGAGLGVILWGQSGWASERAHLVERDYVDAPPAPETQTQAEADAKSTGCLSCHSATDRHTMHAILASSWVAPTVTAVMPR